MNLHFKPVLLALRHPFRLATGMRTHTNAVLTEIHHNGQVGFGEAAMPPYYGENHDTATAFLARASDVLKRVQTETLDLETIGQIMAAIDGIAPGNNAAKASVDIALHDLWGKQTEQPLWRMLGSDASNMPATTFTLGIDTPEVLRQKLKEGDAFNIIKVKLGADDDRSIIRTLREVTDKPIYADANQGWHDREAALDLIFWLQEQGVQLIEQPVPKDHLDDAAWLTARSPLPIIADESFQRLSDLPRVADCFHGVNVKLMKCTGVHEGFRAIQQARERNLKLMIGCMTETSCGIYAASALAPLCNFADLDGCWLISNNPFEMPMLENGRIQLNERSGLGVELKVVEG